MKRMYKVREVIKILEKDGWFLVRQTGSHRQFHHPVKKGTTTVNGNCSDDLDFFYLKSIARQSGIKFKKTLCNLVKLCGKKKENCGKKNVICQKS